MADLPAAGPASLAADVRRRLRARYDRAAFGGDEVATTTGLAELAALQATLDVARGKLLHTLSLRDGQDRPEELACFEQAAPAFREVGDVSAEAEAVFWIGIYHQVVRHDAEAAQPPLDSARELAAAAGDLLTLSYVERHLGFLDAEAGRAEEARSRFEQSLKLRREIDFRPGVAAALLALAEFHAEQGDADRAAGYLTEARQIAEATDSHGVLYWIDQAASS